MIRRTTMTLTVVAIAAGLASSRADAQEMPSLDVKSYCVAQAQTQSGEEPLSPDFFDRCIATEIGAADDLGSIWAALTPEMRQACSPPTEVDPAMPRPGYADMRACVDREIGS